MTQVAHDTSGRALAGAGGGDRTLTWRVFGVLLLGALVGVLALQPYQATLLGGVAAQAGVPVWLLLAASIVQTLGLSALAVGLGLWLGPRVGLGAPLLHGYLSGDSGAGRQLGRALPGAVLAGALAGAVVVGLDLLVFLPLLPESLRSLDAARPTWWQGLLAALFGGIVEEIWLRLGLMTLLVWAGSALVRSRPPAAWIYWVANALAALAFGLAHLPATAVLAPLTPLLLVRALVLNGIPGLVFGWLYWRRGLLAAMVAHFMADVVLHALVGPLLG